MKINKNNKLFLKILSGVVGVALWFAITYTEDPIISQHLGDISIVFEGEQQLMDNGLIIVNKEKIPDISAVIRGKRSNVISAMGTVEAACDVSGIETPGESKVQIKYVYPNSTITMAKTKTREITVETQKLITRNIPIRLVLKNADKNEEFIISPNCQAAKLRIKGAETDVYTASYARVEIDVAEMTENNTQEYFYVLCDKDGNPLSENNITYKSSETIAVENTVYKKAMVPISVKLSESLENDYYMTVKSTSVNQVAVGIAGETVPESLTAYINTIEEGTDYKLKLSVPDDVYLPEENQEITAVCEIVPVVHGTTEVKVEIVNGADKNLRVIPEKIKIETMCPEGFEPSGKIKASVDAKDAEPGDKLTVKIESDEMIKVIGEYMVEVYIK